jgi:hypothetical protein
MVCIHGTLARQCLTCEMVEEIASLRALLAECRPVIERADAVFLPPKGTCTWGPAERDALLARIDALVQP